MVRSFIVSVARHTPVAVKRWVHRHRRVDHALHILSGRGLMIGGDTINIQSGPMAGLRLSVSQHVTHAHVTGTYERETQEVIERFVAPAFVCYDVGASIGYLTLLMARKARQVYAFEPAPHAAEQISRNASASGLNNITLISRPVSGSVREVLFNLTENAYGSRIATPQSRGQKLKLATMTLDDFATTHPPPDFVKIDVEDEEGRVLWGARSILKAKAPIICCELHSKQSAHEVSEILSNVGYKVANLNGEPFHIKDEIVPGDLQILGLPEWLQTAKQHMSLPGISG